MRLFGDSTATEMLDYQLAEKYTEANNIDFHGFVNFDLNGTNGESMFEGVGDVQM